MEKIHGDDGLEPYEFMPLPNLAKFKNEMKRLNVKSYDDVLLYS